MKANVKRHVEAFGTWMHRRILHISWAQKLEDTDKLRRTKYDPGLLQANECRKVEKILRSYYEKL